MNRRKSMPLHGRKLLNRIKKGKLPTNGVNIYTSWNVGRVIPHGVTFPPDALPTDYDWSFLTGQEISLINTEGFAEYEKLKELAVLLVKSGAKSVGLIDAEHPLQWFLPEVKGEAA